MKKINMLFFLIALILALTFTISCQNTIPTPTPVPQTSCEADADCACGTHKDTGECFYGNKAYVNVDKQCPDFCTGIAAMFEIKCVNNSCTQVRKEPEPVAECTVDSDCIPAQCCHPTSCKAGTEQPECAAVLCSMECEPGTLDCGGYCSCDNGKCTAHLNTIKQNDTTPTTKECTVDNDCVPEQCCHPTSCVPVSQKGVCNVACTMECRPGTLDCGQGYCGCDNGKCAAHITNRY